MRIRSPVSSVCGVTGQSFRGSRESKFIAIPALSAARRSRGINREAEEPGPDVRVFGRDNQEDGQRQKAAQTYRQMARISFERTPILHAYPLMSRDVMSLRPDAGVEDAWRQLARRGVGQAPVLDKTLRLVGLVSVQDLLTAVNVQADTAPDIRCVAQALFDDQPSRVPVVNEQEELVGILTRSDILRTLVNDSPLSLWV